MKKIQMNKKQREKVCQKWDFCFCDTFVLKPIKTKRKKKSALCCHSNRFPG